MVQVTLYGTDGHEAGRVFVPSPPPQVVTWQGRYFYRSSFELTTYFEGPPPCMAVDEVPESDRPAHA